MGANFNYLTYDGGFDKAEVTRRFDDAVHESQYESGHSYSGEIGMATGLRFVDKEFESQDEAYEYVVERAEKWGPALAVRFDGKNEKQWFIGAWCSS